MSRSKIFAAFAAVLTFALPSLAIPVTGELNIGGSSAIVGATSLTFSCNPAITLTCPADYGNFLVTPTPTGSFTPYGTDTGFIHNLSQGSQPIGQAFSLPNFLIFNPAGTVVPPDIALDLTFIFPGISGQASCLAAPAAGQVCTPALPALVTPSNPGGLSAFNLQNTQTGSTASFSVRGNARRISTGELTSFTGLFTSQFNVPYQTYLASIASGGTISNSYSATVAVPEPSSITMLLGGLLLVGGYLRRKL
jgi:hypothetical protein